MSAGRITVVGSTNVDMIVQLDHLPALGETVTGGKFVQAFGGKGANQAVAAARAGGNVAFLTAVGDDSNAPLCLENYKIDGIDISCAVTRKGVATGVALIMLDDQGRNYLAIASGANFAMEPSDVEHAHDLIAASSLIIMQNEITPAAALRTLDIAAQAGVPVLFNYAPVSGVPIPVSAKMWYLVVNETEAAQLTGLEVNTEGEIAAAAQKLKTMGPSVVIITLGAQGSYVLDDSGALRIKPYPVKAVDTTAAGDTYCGALAVALLEGKSMADAVGFATAASAISVTKMGAQPSIPRRHEIDNFLSQQNPR